MIISGEGWEAVFLIQHGDQEYWEKVPVVAWQQHEGRVRGLILPGGKGSKAKLVPADEIANFSSYCETEKTTIIPAQPGWYAKYVATPESLANGSRDFDTPVIAWRIGVDGYGITPLTEPDAEGGNSPTELTPGDDDHQECLLIYDPLWIPPKPETGNE